MKNTKKMSKGLLVSLALVVIGMVVVTGVLMSYFYNGTETLDADVIMEYSETGVFGGEEENLETLQKSHSVGNDFCGNDTEILTTFFIKVNSDLDNTADCTWNISDTSQDDPEGLALHLEWNNSGTWTTIIDWNMVDGSSSAQQYDFASGSTYHFRLTITGDEYLMQGTYSALLSLDATSKL